jgi:signal transduction histidine kinase
MLMPLIMILSSGATQLLRFIVLFAACLLPAFSGAAEPRRVLLLHSFGRDFAPFSDLSSRFREELIRRSPQPIDLYEASLEAARFRDPSDESPFVDYLRALFVGRDLDLIATFGSPAAYFFQRYRNQLFPSAPTLIMGVEQRELENFVMTANDVVGAAAAIDFPKLIDSILQLLPQTANLAVVIGNSPFEKQWVQVLRRDFQSYMNRLNFIWFNELPFDEILSRAAVLPPQSAMLYLLLAVDAEGVPYEQDRALARLREVANAPIFSFVDSTFDRGIVGGPLVSNQDHAKRAADVAIRIFGGEIPGNIKLSPIGLGPPIFDWRELHRWSISEQRLPPGSEVRFRPPGVWEQYRPHILAIFAALLSQAALISWLIYEKRRRQKAEILARNTMSELTHSNRMATAGELSASIAHEVNQPLTGIVTRANAALRWLSAATPDVEKARKALAEIVSAGHRASEVVASVRAMFKKESDNRTAVDINKLIYSVLALVEIEIQKHKIRAITELRVPLPTVDGDKIQLQQVILNLVMNGIEAMQLVQNDYRVLRIESQLNESNEVLVSVEDNGTGISSSDLERIFRPLFTTKARGMGMGLSICRSIIEAHSGKLWVVPANERGSIFQFAVPASK